MRTKMERKGFDLEGVLEASLKVIRRQKNGP